MAKRFPDFVLVSPVSGDYLVGYKKDSTFEIRTTIQDIAKLAQDQELRFLFSSNSALYFSSYSTLCSLSSNWNSVYSYTNTNSSFDQAVRSFVNSNSAEILNSYKATSWVFANSSTELAATSFVNSNSAEILNSYKATSWIFANSAREIDVYTIVQANSASWEESAEITAITTAVASNSGNWNNAYNTATVYQSNSATYATILFTNNKFLPLSGGEIIGNLNTTNNLSALHVKFTGRVEEGTNTKALGVDSHAEGNNTIASGYASHAEGDNTVAFGDASHAEGNYTEAIGTYSHAEGNYTKALGSISHAEGSYTEATGDQSHAEGRSTTAIGTESHAEGFITTASGVASHSEGSSTRARGNISHAAGSYSEAVHDRTWIWNGSTSTTHLSTTRADQFMVSAAGGAAFFGNVGINTDSIQNALTVNGNVSATRFFGDGSNITNVGSVALNAKDFGARGDGLTNDWLSLQRALSAAAGIAPLFIPKGLYFISQELRIPSNSYIYGAGIGSTVIKLSSNATATQCVMTNSQNTRSYLTNQGNENIVIKDLELDGNVSRFGGSYSPAGDASGIGLCLAFVRNAFIERISVHDTCRHCIDICAPETSITFNPLDYVPNPSFNVHLKDIIAYGAGDDNITTHFSHNIIIENAFVPYTGGREVPSNSNGIEIDDGSYDITIIGGYIKNCRRGLEIKGHSWSPAGKRVKVYGLTCENNVRNFGFRHLGFDSTDSQTAHDISLYDCTSISPLSSNFTADTPRSLQISNYDGVFIKNFNVVGQHDTGNAVSIQERARNVFIDGMTFTGISGINTGITDSIFKIDNTANRNIKIKNLVYRNCVGLPFYAIGSVPGIEIDGLDAKTTGNPQSTHVVNFTWSPLDVPYNIKNVTISGYLSAYELGGTHNFDYPVPINVGLVENIVPSSPANTNTQYTVARLGWIEGTGQSLNSGIGARIEFTTNLISGLSANRDAPVAFIGTSKANSTDSDFSSSLNFGTRENTLTPPNTRLTITPEGNVGIGTGTTASQRLTISGNLSASGTIFDTVASRPSTVSSSASAIINMVSLSQATYDAIPVKNPQTVYIIV